MIKDNVIKIKALYEGMAENSQTANNKIGAILKDEYLNAQGKEQKSNLVKAELETVISKELEIVNIHIAEIEQKATQTADTLNLTENSFINACNLLNMNLSANTINSLITEFKGQIGRLKIFRELLENKNIKSDIDKYIIDISAELEAVKEPHSTLTKDINSIAYKLNNCYKRIVKLTEALGVDYAESEKQLNVNLDDYNDSVARAVMGL